MIVNICYQRDKINDIIQHFNSFNQGLPKYKFVVAEKGNIYYCTGGKRT